MYHKAHSSMSTDGLPDTHTAMETFTATSVQQQSNHCDSWILTGNEFQTLGAEDRKARDPNFKL